MLKLTLALCCLLAVCCAQPPDPPTMPDIAETFVAKIRVHRRERGEEFMGEGMWQRDMDSGSAIETVTFQFRNHTDTNERLERFDKHMDYDIFKNSTGSYCHKRDIPDDVKMPLVWDFLKKATGRREKDPRTQMMVDIWTVHVGTVELVLIVNDNMVNVPVALIARHRGGEDDMRFESFEPKTPPESAFVVPPACN